MFKNIKSSGASVQILMAIFALFLFAGIIFLSAKVKQDRPVENSEASALEQNGVYYYELGKMYDYAGDRELAYQNLKKAESLLPPKDERLMKIYVLLGRLLLPFDRPFDESKDKEIHKYISLLTDPQNTKTEQSWGYSILAEVLGGENKKIDSINFAKKAVALDPENAAAQHVYGFELFVGSEGGKRIYYMDRLDEAIAAFKRSVEIQETMSPSWYLLGITYWYKGDKVKAQEMWQKSLNLLPDDLYYPAWFKTYLKQKIESAISNPEQFESVRR